MRSHCCQGMARILERGVICAAIATLLAACSGTTVVLVPDASGKVGVVDVSTRAGTTSLSKANQSAEAAKRDEAPGPAVELSDREVQKMFGDTLANEPTPPAHFLFYFASGSAQLQDEAEAELASTREAIQTRKSCDISVIGHSDTVGDNRANESISLERADAVIRALLGSGIDQACMDKRYYGESDLAVRTGDEVDEPRNRRVEVEVR